MKVQKFVFFAFLTYLKILHTTYLILLHYYLEAGYHQHI